MPALANYSELYFISCSCGACAIVDELAVATVGVLCPPLHQVGHDWKGQQPQNDWGHYYCNIDPGASFPHKGFDVRIND